MNAIRFYIIYIPGTVALLRPFLASLVLRSGDCRFCLVSNGCETREQELLREWSESCAKLDFLFTGERKALPHGEVLSMLQQEETSDVFAFMDSDILATGPFLDDLLAGFANCDALFSCSPVWATESEMIMPKEYSVMSGIYHRLNGGKVLGVSYFGLYRNSRLREIRTQFGVDFRRYFWRELRPEIRRELKRQNLAKSFYDTGKLLNLFLSFEKGKLCFRESAHLLHLGGISSLTRVNAVRRRWFSQTLARFHLLRSIQNSFASGRYVSFGEIAYLEKRHQKRREACKFLASLLRPSLPRGRSGRDNGPNELATWPGLEEVAERLRETLAQLPPLFPAEPGRSMDEPGSAV